MLQIVTNYNGGCSSNSTRLCHPRVAYNVLGVRCAEKQSVSTVLLEFIDLDRVVTFDFRSMAEQPAIVPEAVKPKNEPRIEKPGELSIRV